MNKKIAEKTEAIEQLKKILAPGDTVYAIIRKVSKSGMSRTIDLYGKDYMYLTGYISQALGWRRDKSGALKVTGCGMDMVFHTVYCLGCALWPNGTPQPHGTRNGQPDRDGGYALKSRIL